MKVDPLTNRPVVEQAEASARAGEQALMDQGAALQADLATPDGRRHLQDLLEDYQRLVEQMLGATDSFERDGAAAQAAYLKTRLEGWAVKVMMGRMAREAVERRLGRGLVTGGPGDTASLD